ncbi:sugar ABC transporter ATP-binding protein [Martelella lutilitoris]|uniref:Sugar ABC transporter ATP-binding protein n=1 Tax=Martelella lutilitoris TaxID=2583532 RepID=A0A7T7KLA5_9HYPH|nr:sugar ABC transporter ATP-binding protein [Martelella lutilitoris]QQM30500.1 sugar ABC transporter ATP-binding protein [Martelella lutilitoris]
MTSHTSAQRPPLLAVTGLSKSFGRNAVLQDVSFSLGRGEVLALVGENGAGKSTLMNILSGNLPYDSGEIRLAGEGYHPASPAEAAAKGVAIAHQETAIMPDLTVAENTFFRREPRNALGLIRQKRLHADFADLSASLGFTLDGKRLGRRLSAAERQLVEIARAIAAKPDLLILDEPTASLSAEAAQSVLRLMNELKRDGTSIIFISHRMGEIMTAADRVVVLKDGALTLEAERGAFAEDDLIQAMVGRKLENIFPERPALADLPVRFSVTGGTNADLPEIDFSVRRGEVLGIAGLEGQGQKPLADALCGIAPFRSGAVELDGKAATLKSPAAAIGAGIASIPDDRKHEGLALSLPIRLNMSLFAISERARAGLLPLGYERQFVEGARERFSIRSTDMEQPAGELSGGNQQKVVFARWLAHTPKLLVLYEPTKGVDVQSKSEIYHLVDALSKKGVSVILISSDLMELIGLSDRILALYEGRITGEIARPDFSEEKIMRYAAGLPSHGLGSAENGEAALV